MVKLHRVAQVRTGRYKEALEFLVRAATLLRQGRGLDAQVYSCRFGLPVGHVVFEVDLPDLAAVEELQRQLNGDSQHRERLGEMRDVFVEGSVKDLLLLSVNENDPVFKT